MRYLIVLTIAAAVLIAGATVASADPNVPNIAAHRHFLATPSGGLVQVGPKLCDDARVQSGFNQFHINSTPALRRRRRLSTRSVRSTVLPGFTTWPARSSSSVRVHSCLSSLTIEGSSSESLCRDSRTASAEDDPESAES